MEQFDVHILGCGSALPTLRHNPSSQVVNVREKLYMVDCGEGTQLQLRRMHLKFTRLSQVFISHMHGDHIFGLIGMISTFALLGRTAALHIYADRKLESFLRPQLEICCKGMSYEVVFHSLPRSDKPELVFEDRSVEVHTLPLKHRIPCWGFLFKEKATLPHIRRDMIDFLQIPYYAIRFIKEGEGWTTAEGDFYPHERLVIPAAPARTYAYCSDTTYVPENAQWLEGVDLLYHEATFGQEYAGRAAETFHSTARQAAELARAAQVHKLVLGHFSSRYDSEETLLKEAQAVFPSTELAREGMVYHL